jgi:nucleoside-diphosphate-sugar epimerase
LARCLIIGCGCRGSALGQQLREGGHAVRATTRDPRRLEQLESSNFEGVLADPDRIATLAGAFDHVTVACLLLGSAAASAEQVKALHSSRLQMLLGRMLDTTIRGIVYEASGTVGRSVLEAGARSVRRACEGSRIPYELLRADPADHLSWLDQASGAAERLLES